MKRPSDRGFTIVESMIVLAISGAMFAALAMMVSGQQSKARFNSAANDVVAKIQSQINEVSTGAYSVPGTFGCQQHPSGRVAIINASESQGSNQECVYLGSALMFGTNAAEQSEYVAHTLVGLRRVSGQTAKTLRESRTTTLTNGNSTGHSFSNNLHETNTLQFDLEPVWMTQVDGPATSDVIGVAFVLSPDQLSSTTNNTLDSGTVVVQTIGIPTTGLSIDPANPGVDVPTGVDQITRSLGTPLGSGGLVTTTNPSNGVKICFNQGEGSERSVLVTIGGNKSNTAVTSMIYQNEDCS